MATGSKRSTRRRRGDVATSQPAAEKGGRARATTTRARTTPAITPAIAALSRALREARQRTGLSQRAAAKKIGVHYVTLYTWENDRRPEQPTDANLARVARLYGTTSAALRGADAESAGARAGATPPPAEPDWEVAVPGDEGTAVVAMTLGASAAGDDLSADSPLPRRVYGRVFRLLADLAEHTELGASELSALQQALTAPALFRVFGTLTPNPRAMSEDEVLAAVDAAGVAVRSFVASRGRGSR